MGANQSELKASLDRLPSLRNSPAQLKDELNQFVAVCPLDAPLNVRIDKKVFDILHELFTQEMINEQNNAFDRVTVFKALQRCMKIRMFYTSLARADLSPYVKAIRKPRDPIALGAALDCVAWMLECKVTPEASQQKDFDVEREEAAVKFAFYEYKGYDALCWVLVTYANTEHSHIVSKVLDILSLDLADHLATTRFHITQRISKLLTPHIAVLLKLSTGSNKDTRCFTMIFLTALLLQSSLRFVAAVQELVVRHAFILHYIIYSIDAKNLLPDHAYWKTYDKNQTLLARKLLSLLCSGSGRVKNRELLLRCIPIELQGAIDDPVENRVAIKGASKEDVQQIQQTLWYAFQSGQVQRVNCEHLFNNLDEEYKLPHIVWVARMKAEMLDQLRGEIIHYQQARVLVGQQQWDWESFAITHPYVQKWCRVGHFYVSLLSSALQNSKTYLLSKDVLHQLVSALFQRAVIEDDPTWKLACLGAIASVYESHPDEFKEMLFIPYYIYLLQPQRLEPIWRDHILSFMPLLLKEQSNAKRFVDYHGVMPLISLINGIHALESPDDANVEEDGDDHPLFNRLTDLSTPRFNNERQPSIDSNQFDGLVDEDSSEGENEEVEDEDAASADENDVSSRSTVPSKLHPSQPRRTAPPLHPPQPPPPPPPPAVAASRRPSPAVPAAVREPPPAEQRPNLKVQVAPVTASNGHNVEQAAVSDPSDTAMSPSGKPIMVQYAHGFEPKLKLDLLWDWNDDKQDMTKSLKPPLPVEDVCIRAIRLLMELAAHGARMRRQLTSAASLACLVKMLLCPMAEARESAIRLLLDLLVASPHFIPELNRYGLFPFMIYSFRFGISPLLVKLIDRTHTKQAGEFYEKDQSALAPYLPVPLINLLKSESAEALKVAMESDVTSPEMMWNDDLKLHMHESIQSQLAYFIQQLRRNPNFAWPSNQRPTTILYKQLATEQCVAGVYLRLLNANEADPSAVNIRNPDALMSELVKLLSAKKYKDADLESILQSSAIVASRYPEAEEVRHYKGFAAVIALIDQDDKNSASIVGKQSPDFVALLQSRAALLLCTVLNSNGMNAQLAFEAKGLDHLQRVITSLAAQPNVGESVVYVRTMIDSLDAATEIVKRYPTALRQIEYDIAFLKTIIHLTSPNMTISLPQPSIAAALLLAACMKSDKVLETAVVNGSVVFSAQTAIFFGQTHVAGEETTEAEDRFNYEVRAAHLVLLDCLKIRGNKRVISMLTALLTAQGCALTNQPTQFMQVSDSFDTDFRAHLTIYLYEQTQAIEARAEEDMPWREYSDDAFSFNV